MLKAATVHYLNVSQWQKYGIYARPYVRQGRPKGKDNGGPLISTTLLNMNVLGQIVGILEPENRKVGHGFSDPLL